MRGIAKLLFGGGPVFDNEAVFDDGAGRVLDRLAGGDNERAMTEQVLRSGEWCGSTPGRGASTPGHSASTPGSGSAAAGRRPRRSRSEIISGEVD
jgi:hypothetical protein